MKINSFFMLALLLMGCFIKAQSQEDKSNKNSEKNVVTISEDGDKTEINVSGIKLEVKNYGDTITKITIGTRRFEVIEDHDKARVRMVRIPRETFKGHWAGVDMGFNGYMNSDFSTDLDAGAGFMDLNMGKSVTLSLNFLQYNIGLQKHKNNIGMIIGAGWTFYNYRTDKPYNFIKDDLSGQTIGVPIASEYNVKKNKITTSFINFPLLFEFQVPAGQVDHRLFLSAGGYCGFRLGGHTKMVYDADGSRKKDKSGKDINLNPVQYGAMVRVGYRFIKLYATYNFSTFYSDNKGPELYPYTIGLTLLSF